MKRLAVCVLCGCISVAALATTNVNVTVVAPQVDAATGVVLSPTNLYTANSIARCIAQIVSMTNDCSGPWYASGIGTLTNDAGWLTTGTTNGSGAITLGETQYVQSALGSCGYAGQTNTASGGPIDVGISADGTTWTNAAGTGTAVYVRWTAGTNTVSIDDLVVYGWAQTSQVGRVQDFAGLRIRVDAPGGDPRDVATANYVAQQIATALLNAGAANWAAYPAAASVDLAGRTMHMDTNYAMSVTNGSVLMTCTGAPVWEVSSTGGLAIAIRVPIKLYGAVSGAGMSGYVSTSELTNFLTVAAAELLYLSTNAAMIQWGRQSHAGATNSVVLGHGAIAYGGVSVGDQAWSTHTNGIALGRLAIANGNDVIQIGEGINMTTGTVQIRDWRLLENNGSICLDRMPTASRSVTNAWADAAGVTHTQIFLRGLLKSWTENGSEVP